jgi:hypothetical protein
LLDEYTLIRIEKNEIYLLWMIYYIYNYYRNYLWFKLRRFTALDNLPMDNQEKQTKSLILVSLTGDVLMIIEDVNKEFIWSSILDKIATEEWYQTCKKWKFVLELNNLKPDDILEFKGDSLKIVCIKIVVPQIYFELPDGKLLVSIPFDSCKSWHDKKVYVIGACFEAHKKLKELGKDGYGTERTKIHPFINIYKYDCCETHCNETHHGNDNNYRRGGLHPYPYPYIYVFRDKNNNLLSSYDVLEDPGNDNVKVIAVPKQVFCSNNCKTKFYGPLRNGEQRKVLNETVSLCSVCGFLHCRSCGIYGEHMIGSFECRISCNM